jgi:hypothetical protein
MTSIFTLLLVSASISFAQQSTPAGFDKQLVYMGTGVYDPDDPNYEAPDGDF